jgi:replicative superfamily II helicase
METNTATTKETKQLALKKKEHITKYIESIGVEKNQKIDYKSLGFSETTKLYEYQQKCVKAITSDMDKNPSFGKMLNAEPGLGKTLMGIAVILHRLRKYGEKAGNTLIVVPLQIEYQWCTEFATHTTIDPSMIKRYLDSGDKVVLTKDKPNIVITTYSVLASAHKNEINWIFQSELFQLIITDEGHLFKNQKTIVCLLKLLHLTCGFQRYEAIDEIKNLSLFGLPQTKSDKNTDEMEIDEYVNFQKSQTYLKTNNNKVNTYKNHCNNKCLLGLSTYNVWYIFH